MSANIRTQLAGMLAPLLPPRWRIIPVTSALDELDRTVVQLQQTRITPFVPAPYTYHTATFTITIVSPIRGNEETAEDLLDEDLSKLLFALDQLPDISWSSADKIVYADTYLAYTVDVEINTQKG